MYKDSYFEVAYRISDYLLNNQLNSGAILDSVLNEKSPDDHYAHTFFGLSAIMLYNRTNEVKWAKAGKKAINYYLTLPERLRGARDFNNFALLMTYRKLYEKGKFFSEILDGLKDYFHRMKFDSTPFGKEGNNWLVIRAVDHELMYKIFHDVADRLKAQKLVEKYVLTWQLDDGFFYDYPKDKRCQGQVATPLTYHTKICAMLLMYYTQTKNINALNSALKGLDVLSSFISPLGEAFYFGRSNNALFGYVSAIYAYELATAALRKSLPQIAKLYKACADRLFSFIKPWQQVDGHVAIAPNLHEVERCGWDSYMYCSVYNAYASVMLLLASEVSEYFGAGAIPSDDRFRVGYAKRSGLLSIKLDDLFLAMNVKGQLLTDNGSDFAGSRYYGLSPLCLTYGKTDLLPPPTIDKLSPEWTGFLPYVCKGRLCYGAGLFDEANAKVEGERIFVYGKGRLFSCQPASLIRWALSNTYRSIKLSHFSFPGFFELCHLMQDSKSHIFKKKGEPIKQLAVEFLELEFYRMIVIIPENIIFLDALRSMNEQQVNVSLLPIRLYDEMEGWTIKSKGNMLDCLPNGSETGFCIQSIRPANTHFSLTHQRVPTSKGYSCLWEGKRFNWNAYPGDAIGSTHVLSIQHTANRVKIDEISKEFPLVRHIQVKYPDSAKSFTLEVNMTNGAISVKQDFQDVRLGVH